MTSQGFKMYSVRTEKWGVQVYLEPGEAVALNAGYLAAHVLDIVENNGMKCHPGRQCRLPYARCY